MIRDIIYSKVSLASVANIWFFEEPLRNLAISNQSVSQSINQPINQSINQSINQMFVFTLSSSCVVAGITELKVKKFRAKIDYNNQPSLQLFQKKLHFIEVGR